MSAETVQSSLGPVLAGDVESLQRINVFVAIPVLLKGSKGHAVVDYRTNSDFLKAVGKRAFVNIVSPVHAKFVGSVPADAGYSITLVHHDRNNTSVPTSHQSVALQEGASFLQYSQAKVVESGPVGFAVNVTKLVKPDPAEGHSPRLVLYFDSFNRDSTSVASVVVKFWVEVRGNDTPDFS